MRSDLWLEEVGVRGEGNGRVGSKGTESHLQDKKVLGMKGTL